MGIRTGLGPLLLVAAAGAIARADTPPRNIEDLSLEDLLNVETTSATKLEQPAREAPAVMNVITAENIESYGDISLNDILARQPGFAPSQDYERQTVTARGHFEGWNNNHLLMLVDGVPVNDTIYGSAYTWEITPLVLVQSLDVIRGPGSALYGSSATNGVLALHTPTASELPTGRALFRFGNAGTRIYDVSAAHQFRHWSFVLGYNHYETDGNVYDSYDGSGRTDAQGNLARFGVKDARSSDYVFVKVEGEGRLRGLSAQLHLQFWKFETGHGWLFYIPDTKERMQENRQLAWINYHPPASHDGRFQQDYVLSYQRHGIDWHMKFYPDNTDIGGTVYPGGLVENLQTQAHQLFARVQYSYRFWREMTLLAGVEDSLFLYTGDSEHTANADLDNGGTYAPVAGLQALRPWFEYVTNKPVDNIGIFAQLATGRFWSRRLSITAGVRYDLQYFQYVDINAVGGDRPVLSQNFNQVSPRAAVVLFPHRDLVLKAIVNRAFRAPAPSELFGANTYTLASNIQQLRPESITTVETSFDWLPSKYLDLRANWYYERFENQIAYSVSNNNLSTNLYSRSVTGLEAEAQWNVPLGAQGQHGKIGGFFNYSYVYLIDEDIEDSTITKTDHLTWAPSHVFNVGVSYLGRHLGVSVHGHYQGEVDRRLSDGDPIYRAAAVKPWFTLDARASYSLSNWVRLGVQASNILNTRGYLIKNNNFPFDYQIPGTRVLGTLELDIRDIPSI